MIRYNLAKLMIDRNISATTMFNDIGIARSTISKISNNHTDKISIDTLSKICNYLNVTPNEFFDYIPIEYNFEVEFSNYSNFDDLIEEFYINQSETKYDQILLNISFIKYGNEKIMIGYTGSCSIHQEGFGEIIFSDIEFSIEKEDIEKLTIFNEIPIQFQIEIVENITAALYNELSVLYDFSTKDLTTYDESKYHSIVKKFN